jgi:hypothetical protein
MKQLLLASLLLIVSLINAQDKGNKKKLLDVKRKPNDHFMLQFANDNWTGAPDSINTGGFGRSGNIYAMMNFPFKSSRHFSVAIGAGFGTSNIYLKEQEANISGTSQLLTFRRTDTTDHFKKYKIVTAYLEAPIEFRWLQNPENADKSFKVALGVKVGTLLTAATKGRHLQNKSDATINNKLVEKVKDKRYFNSSRIALTARIGWGHFSVFGQYQVTSLFKENLFAEVRPYSIGITLSGL